MRETALFQIPNTPLFRQQVLAWAATFDKCCFLDSNSWNGSTHELIIGVGVLATSSPTGNSFSALQRFHHEKKDWLFGHLSYDLKNELENLHSHKYDGINFPEMHFFQPELVLILKGDRLEIKYFRDPAWEKKLSDILQKIQDCKMALHSSCIAPAVQARVSREEYLLAVKSIKQHISKGDIYEMNFCQEFFSENAEIIPEATFFRLSEASLSPFSAFYRLNDKYLLCASPERYLKKEGNRIVSQPIKGTSRRGANEMDDVQAATMLAGSEKDRSENVMIVDLVRNDLSQTCEQVKVDELFGIYTFKQWHQMISTVSGTLRNNFDFAEVLRTTFPMGSMTGAPKMRAMELIEKYEKTKRGLYSGAVGYITPDGDFDFNVVIRSILYNKTRKYLSFQAGSAITARSIAENEYQECLLKTNGMFEALGAKPISVNRYPLMRTAD